MKKTIETLKNHVSELEVIVKKVTKEERQKNFLTFKESTLKELSKSFMLTTKESNNLSSAYVIKDNFVKCLRAEKLESLKDNDDDLVESIYTKVLAHAVKRVTSELKEIDNMIYCTYEFLKNNDIASYNEYMLKLLGIESTKAFFTFNRAYMFTTDKPLSKNAYVKRFIALIIALKEYQGNYSVKFENVTYKHIIKDVKTSTFDIKNYTYEGLKALVEYVGYGSELVNDNMVVDTRVLKKALKEVLILTQEEENVFYEIFK